MTTEDYVSFEVAKLLKEKGFDIPLNYFYNSDGRRCYATSYNWNQTTGDFQDYSCPTHQMAIEWLREVYGLHIWVEYSRFDFNKEHPYLWNIVETKIDGDYWEGTYNKFSKNAVESALNYALENLI